jgi:hypothetical protein
MMREPSRAAGEPTLLKAMAHLLVVALWSCLGVSLAFSIWGIVQKRWQPLALGAVLSGTFSAFAILSIGFLTRIVTLAQIVVAATMYSRSHQTEE